MSKKELANVASDEVLAQLGESYPIEQGGLTIQLPRLGLVSQDITKETGTGKNKKIEVVTPAGEFYIDQQTEEVDKDGKNVWSKEEIGDGFEGIIVFKRKQLRLYDEATEKYTSSPIYDNDDEVLPLFCDKKEIARGTPAELKEKYEFTTSDGKVKSKLEDNRISYILYKGELYQMNLRGSSMWSLAKYEKTVVVPTVLTAFGSTAETKGQISWNKMSFKVVRKITGEEAKLILEKQDMLKKAIALSKASYAKASPKKKEIDTEEEAKKAFEELE